MRILLVVLACACVVGCLSPSDQARIDALGQRIVALEKQAEDIVAQAKAGTLPIDQAKVMLEEIRKLANDAQAEIRDIKASGASNADIFWGIVTGLLSTAASMGGVRAWRGPATKKG